MKTLLGFLIIVGSVIAFFTIPYLIGCVITRTKLNKGDDDEWYAGIIFIIIIGILGFGSYIIGELL